MGSPGGGLPGWILDSFEPQALDPAEMASVPGQERGPKLETDPRNGQVRHGEGLTLLPEAETFLPSPVSALPVEGEDGQRAQEGSETGRVLLGPGSRQELEAIDGGGGEPSGGQLLPEPPGPWLLPKKSPGAVQGVSGPTQGAERAEQCSAGATSE